MDELHQTKQDTLTAGEGITIEENVISSTGGGGETSSIRGFAGHGFNAWKHVVTSGGKSLVTFSFECLPNNSEVVLTSALKEELEGYLYYDVSNGAITISNDGTNMKLINSAPSENVSQHATFTFTFNDNGGGGGSV